MDTESGVIVQDIKKPYDLKVDPTQADRAKEFKLFSVARPHMRAFHLSWLGFFVAFLAWFSFAPLMPLVKEALGLVKNDIWVANICSVSSTIFFRFAIGPLCDRIGGRKAMGSVLLVFAIPVAIGGFAVQNATDLAVVRFFVGVIGCVFVPCQYWVQAMFTHQLAGSTQAMAGGWGNLGGGVTQFFMPVVYSAFRASMSEEAAWRSCFIVPALIIMGVGLTVIFCSDDCPKGQYKELQSTGQMVKADPGKNFKIAASQADSWVLFVQYACCFGVELTMNNLVASYFYNEFGLGLVTAGFVASSFGLMNLFARALGGIVSDWAFHKFHFGKHPLNSRILVHGLILFYEGLMIICFSQCNTLGTAIFVLLLFSVGVQMAEGTSFGLVPYVKKSVTGAVSGIVGAGGNVGAMCWGFIFLFGPDRSQDCLLILGFIVMASSVASFGLKFSEAKVSLEADAEALKAVDAETKQ